jgi:hypothetical protein
MVILINQMFNRLAEEPKLMKCEKEEETPFFHAICIYNPEFLLILSCYWAFSMDEPLICIFNEN